MWIVSIWSKSPAFWASGRGNVECHRFHGLLSRRSQQRFSVLFTLLKLTSTHFSFNSWWTILPHRLCLFLCSTIASIISFFKAQGLLFGLELCVGIILLPSSGAFLTQRITAVWWKPKYIATFLIDQPFLTSITACILTLGKCGFDEYAISSNFTAGWCQAIETLRKGWQITQYWLFIILNFL